jgi:protein-tyrosine-phosphatase
VIHPNTIEAARRADLRLSLVKPRHIDDVTNTPDIVVTVCDEAREDVEVGEDWLHWSLPDPIRSRSVRAFERTIEELHHRVDILQMTLAQKSREEEVWS